MESMKANLPAMAQVASTTLSAIGGLNKASGYEAAGVQRQQLASMEASQLRESAKLSVAAGIQDAREQERQGRLAASRALAVAAASGGGASDPTVMNIIAGLSGEATYRAMTSLYEGQERGRLMRNQAAMTEYGGKIAAEAAQSQATASRFGAFATVGKDVISMFSKYGKNGKPKSELWSAPANYTEFDA